MENKELKQSYIDERTGIEYILINDYYIPNIVLPKPRRTGNVGKYGRMRARYLRENKKVEYSIMLIENELTRHLLDIDDICKERVDMLVKQIAEKENVNKELNVKNQIKWMQMMNNILNRAEEIVINEIAKSQYKAMQVVNKELIFMYWNIGKIILANSEWGNKFIDNLSIDLKLEFPNSTGFSVRNLKYMRKFAEEYNDFEFVQQVVAQIPWGHNIVLLDKIKDIEERKWYIDETIKNGWSRNMLKIQIDGKVYERQAIAEKVTNFPRTLPDIQSDLAIQTMKDPYLFDFISIKGRAKELEIENAMINKIKDVLIELGKGFAFVGNQYKIVVSGKEYFVDLLFYHLKLKRKNNICHNYISKENNYCNCTNKTISELLNIIVIQVSRDENVKDNKYNNKNINKYNSTKQNCKSQWHFNVIRPNSNI